jgi:glycerol-3-phosphate acyltransferase PlsY
MYQYLTKKIHHPFLGLAFVSVTMGSIGLGEILLESTKNVRTVVNKTAGIDNTYRYISIPWPSGNFQFS